MNPESLDSIPLAPGIKNQMLKRNLRKQKQFGTAGKTNEEHTCSGNVCEAVWKPTGDGRMLNGQKS